MSFDINLFNFNNENEEPIPMPTEPIREVLKKYGITEYGDPIWIEMPDGCGVDFFCGGLEDETVEDLMLQSRSAISSGVIQFLYDIALSGPFVIYIPAPLIVDERSAKHIPNSLTEEDGFTLCKNIREFTETIGSSFQEWANWASNTDE